MSGEDVERFTVQWTALVEAHPTTLTPGALQLRADLLRVTGVAELRDRIALLEAVAEAAREELEAQKWIGRSGRVRAHKSRRYLTGLLDALEEA